MKNQLICWKNFKILILLSVFLVPIYLYFSSGIAQEMFDEIFTRYSEEDTPRAITALGLTIAPIAICAYLTSILARILFLSSVETWNIFLRAMYFLVIVGAIVFVPLFFFAEVGGKNDSMIELLPSSYGIDKKIITPSGSVWTKQKKSKNGQYFHVVANGESLEYIFNNMETSVKTAREQGYGIGIREQDIYKGVPLDSVLILYGKGIFLYSNLLPGDTVYLAKAQLNSMTIHTQDK